MWHTVSQVTTAVFLVVPAFAGEFGGLRDGEGADGRVGSPLSAVGFP